MKREKRRDNITNRINLNLTKNEFEYLRHHKIKSGKSWEKWILDQNGFYILGDNNDKK